MSDFALEGVVRLRDQTKQATESASRGVDSLQKTLNIAKTALTAFGVIEAGKAVVELAKLGVQAERAQHGFETISGGSLRAEANLRAMNRATGGAIDKVSSMQIASQMMQMGLAESADELERNATLAVRLGRAMGVDATTAMQNWNAMMANQSLPRLDTYGISSGKVRTRINELTTAIEGMTREEAFSIAVMEEGEKALARLGPATEDNALKVEQQTAAFTDLKNEWGQAYGPVLGWVSGALGGFTRGLTSNVTATREAREEFGFLAGSLDGLLDMFGIIPTRLDAFKEAQEDAARATEFGAVMAQGYAARLDLVRTHTDGTTTATNTAKTAADQYNQAIANAQAAQDQFSLSQQRANQAAAEGETAFLNAAAALDELSLATLARQELDKLREELDEGRLTQEEYAAATRAILTEFDLLTPAEEAAQGELEALRKAYLDGHLTADQYAQSVRRVKENIDELESRSITIKINWDAPPLPQPTMGQGGAAGPTHQMHAEGGTAYGGLAMVGERGPELVQMPRGSQVFTAQETRQVVNNYHFDLNANYQPSPTLQDDIRTLAMLYRS